MTHSDSSVSSSKPESIKSVEESSEISSRLQRADAKRSSACCSQNVPSEKSNSAPKPKSESVLDAVRKLVSIFSIQAIKEAIAVIESENA